ncbi:MAG: 50S ribosomal protein L4 [Candidatus Omnitrophica bacterium]|nr:50S ribosomal protein L4 [Candidatus Omnitrophota bacterium]
MVKLPVLDINGTEVEQIDLPEGVFGGRVKSDIIHQAVVMYQACLRQGTVNTKVRKEISGGGKKPFKQKGTGQARAGSSRSPLWHKGGVVFGPHPRDFGYTIPVKVRRAALRESLNAKFLGQSLVCVQDFKSPLNKTKEFAGIMKNLKLKGKVLACLEGSDASIDRVTNNLPFFNAVRAQDVNAYDVMKFNKLLVTKTAFQKILERIEKC